MSNWKELVALDQQEMHNEDLDNLIKIPRHVANGAFKEITQILKMQYLVNHVNDLKAEVLVPDTNAKIILTCDDKSIIIEGPDLSSEPHIVLLNEEALAPAKCAHQIEELIIELTGSKNKPSCVSLYVFLILLSIIIASHANQEVIAQVNPLPKELAYILFIGTTKDNIVKEYEFKATSDGNIIATKWEEEKPNFKTTYAFSTEDWINDTDKITNEMFTFFDDLKEITRICKG